MGRMWRRFLTAFLAAMFLVLVLPYHALGAQEVSVVTRTVKVERGFETVKTASSQVSSQYYSQLSSDEKKGYRALAKTNLKKKSSTWKMNVSFYTSGSIASDFGKLLKHAKMRKLLSQAERALYAFRLDFMHETYWMYDCDVSFNYSVISDGSQKVQVVVHAVIYTPIPYYPEWKEDEKALLKAFDKVENYVKKNRKDGSRYESLKALVTYMARNMKYGKIDNYTSYTPSGMLLAKYGKTGTCEGYAKVMFVICKRLGIPIVYMESMTHAYNYVQMDDGKWYGMDVTWADIGNKVDYVWFLYGTEAARRNDPSNAHYSQLYRNGISLQPISISKTSYVIPVTIGY